MNNSSNSSVVIAVGKCKKKIKRRRDHLLVTKTPLFLLLTTGLPTKSFIKKEPFVIRPAAVIPHIT